MTMTTTYYFSDKLTFKRCIDHLHASTKYKLVGNYRPRIIARKYHICPLCDPEIYDRIDQWYNCGKWNTTWNTVTGKTPTTYEEFIDGAAEYTCDICQVADVKMYHCTRCLYDVCSTCYEQKHHQEHQRIEGEDHVFTSHRLSVWA